MTDIARSVRILMLTYSHSGQSNDIADALAAGLEQNEGCEVARCSLSTQTPRPFPWSFTRFFGQMPESIARQGEPIQPLDLPDRIDLDLVILCWPVWFLSPTPAMLTAIRDPDLIPLLEGRPVLSVVTARGMWQAAAEDLAADLRRHGAGAVASIGVRFRVSGAGSFLSAPAWMLTGRKGPFLRGLVPEAGFAPEARTVLRDAGRAMTKMIRQDGAPWQGSSEADARRLQACFREEAGVDCGSRIGSPWAERIGQSYFRFMGRLMRKAGGVDTPKRNALIVPLLCGLTFLIVFVLPFVALAWKIRQTLS